MGRIVWFFELMGISSLVKGNDRHQCSVGPLAEARNEASDAFKRASRTDGPHSSDPFSDYQSESYEEESGDYEEGGWGEEAR